MSRRGTKLRTFYHLNSQVIHQRNGWQKCKGLSRCDVTMALTAQNHKSALSRCSGSRGVPEGQTEAPVPELVVGIGWLRMEGVWANELPGCGHVTKSRGQRFWTRLRPRREHAQVEMKHSSLAEVVSTWMSGSRWRQKITHPWRYRKDTGGKRFQRPVLQCQPLSPIPGPPGP